MSEYKPGFMEFWSAYPRKQAKSAAWKAWEKLGAETDLFVASAIKKDIAKRKECGWFDNLALDKVPHPASYLSGRRWEDEGIEQEVNSKARGSRRSPPPSVLQHTDEPYEPWWHPCGRLWLMYALQGANLKITIDQAVECRIRAKSISEHYREEWGDRSIEDAEYGQLLEMMGTDLIQAWNKIVHAPKGHWDSFEAMNRARPAPGMKRFATA